jgi:hypothetical protein
MLYFIQHPGMQEASPETRIPVVVGFFTDLQTKIVRHVGTNNNASYRTLIEDIGKDRVTIMQCLNSLIDTYRYIDKRKISPDFEKSKLIFSLTSKGIAAAWLRKVISLDEIAKNISGKGNVVVDYIKFVHQTFNSSNRNLMIEPLFRKLDKTYAGYEPGSNEEKNVVRDCFLKGIIDLCFDRFNLDGLNRNKGIAALRKLFSDTELEDMKKYLAYGRDNLNSTIKKLPK